MISLYLTVLLPAAVMNALYLTYLLLVYNMHMGVSGGRHSRHPTRLTRFGRVRGFVDTIYNNEKVEKYFGIPYAKPPVGDLRFEVRQSCIIFNIKFALNAVF